MKNSLRLLLQLNTPKNIIRIVLAALVLSCFFSCSGKARSASITGKLDEVDRYIVQGQTESALKLLKKTDRQSLSYSVRLGIYKRYIQLGEKKYAEKLLKSCLKKNPSEKKLIAVYSSFLLHEKKYDEAFDLSKKLAGSEYGSIYSEAMLRKKIMSGEKLALKDYCVPEYSLIFFDAYSGSKDNRWLRNCACISLVQSLLADAYNNHPGDFSDASDAYFWSCVSYDNKKFVEAAEDLKTAKRLCEYELQEVSSSKKQQLKRNSDNLKILALLSDTYINLSEEKLAGQERDALLAYISTLDEEEYPAGDENKISNPFADIDILSIIYLNSALWSLSREDLNGAYKLLSFEVEKWPDYVPGLIAYGAFAYNSNLKQLDDPMTLELRKYGVSSMDMKAYDSLPRIPVEDALAKMQDSLSRFKNYQLYVAKLDLEDKITKDISEKKQLARIYQTVERNTLGTNEYPPEIARYAVYGLLSLSKIPDAHELFNNYIAKRYGFDSNQEFNDEFFRHIHEMEIWEVEYSAWFAATEKKASLAKQLYEFIVYNEYLIRKDKTLELSAHATGSAIMNLAMIYSSTNDKESALKLYALASGKTQNVNLKAESFYRIGSIYAEQKNKEDAVKALRYCIFLNPSHSKARLILSGLN